MLCEFYLVARVKKLLQAIFACKSLCFFFCEIFTGCICYILICWFQESHRETYQLPWWFPPAVLRREAPRCQPVQNTTFPEPAENTWRAILIDHMFCYSYCIPRFLICPTASVRRYPAIYLIYHMREMRFLSLFLFCKRNFFVLPTFRCSAGYIGCYFCFFSTPKIAIKEHRSRNIG